MESKSKKINYIYESFENGQVRQAVREIDEYGLYDFWEDYRDFLNNFLGNDLAYNHFAAATISYHRIKSR